jgi:hypothetical protein
MSDAMEAHSDDASEAREMPSQNILALLAATLISRKTLSFKESLDAAFELWILAGKKLTDERSKEEVYQHPQITLPDDLIPAVFPVSFDHFLKLVVRGNIADRAKKFRDYLTEFEDGIFGTKLCEKERIAYLNRLKTEGFKNERSWRLTASNFLFWYRTRVSKSKKRNAEQRWGKKAP